MAETATAWPPKEVQQPKPAAEASSVQPEWPPKEVAKSDQWPPKEVQPVTDEGFKPEPALPLPKPSTLFPGGTVASQYDPRNFPAGTVFPKQPSQVAPPDAGKAAVQAQAALGAAPRPAPPAAPEPPPLTPEQQEDQDRAMSWIGGGGAPMPIPKGPAPAPKPMPWPTAPDDTEAASWMGGGGAPITVTAPPTEQERAQQQAQEAQKQAQEDQTRAAAAAATLPDITTAQVQPTQPDGQVAGQPQYQYPFEDRVAALQNRFGNREDLLNSWKSLPPDQAAQLRDVYEAAMLDSPHDRPGALEGTWRGTTGAVGSFIGNIIGAPKALLDIGSSASEAAVAIAKLRVDPDSVTPKDQAAIRTVIAAAEVGHQGNVELIQAIKRAYTRHLNSISGKLDSGDNMDWKQIMSLEPNQRLTAIRDKMDQEQARVIQMQLMSTGHLAPGWQWFQKSLYPVGSKSPMTPEILERDHGIKIDPSVVGNDSILLNEGTVLLPFADAALEGVLSKATGLGMEASANVYRGFSAAARKIEPAVEWAGGKAGYAAGRGVAKAVQQAVLHPIPDPVRWWIPTGPVGRWAGQVGENVGRGIGSIPRLARTNFFDPVAEAIRTRGLDMQYGTNNTLANGGAWAPLTSIVSGSMKGGLYTMPYLLNPDLSPEERGQAVGFGMALGGMHEAPLAIRDAAMSSLYFRDPAKYQSLGYAPINYGTSFGGMNFDQGHNAFVATKGPLDQARINDSRGQLSNIEQYHLFNGDYQAATAHLQRTVNPNTGETYLPQGNLRSRGFSILQDPGTGKTVILINGDHSGLETAPHEIAHAFWRDMSPTEQAIFKQAALEKNDPDTFTQWYTKNLTGRGVNWTDLPTAAGIANGTEHYLPGLDYLTREGIIEEMGAETGAALLRGQPLSHFTTNRPLFRQLQFALGAMFEKMGINMTPAEATTVLGVKPGAMQSWVLDQAMRDYFKRNPANKPGPPAGGGAGPGPTPGPKGRKAATGGPTGGPAQRPTPPPTGGPKPQTTPVITNNQPEIGGGSTGAAPEEVSKAVDTLVNQFRWKKKDAQALVGSVSGQSAGELVLHALQEHGKTARGFEQGGFRTPQQAQAGEAPILPHPLASHRLMQTGELTRRATLGDQQAVQTLIERHGVNWLQDAEKADPDAARMYRRRYPDEAAAQDQRIKVAEANRVQVEERAKAEGKPEPKVVDGNRINELRAQAESEVGPKIKNRDAVVNRRHLQLVMEEHNASLPSGDTRVRAQVDPETGRTTYYGTHFDPNDPVHQWLLSQMDPEERKFMMRAQDAIANQSSMNFNYTHAARIEPGEELPTGPEREQEYEEQTAKERAAGKVEGQVGNRTALPISVGVGADGQGLVYTMATDKIIANAIKSVAAMRSAKMTPPYTPDRAGMLEMQQDMRRVAQNHTAGYSGDGSKALVGTRDRPIVRDANYVPQPVPEERAQFINMVMNARDPIAGPRVTKAGRTTAAGKAVEFAEANQGYTSPIVSHGQERVEVNPLRKELERRGAFKGRELEHGYEQFRGDLMRERDEPAPALRKHGIEAAEFTAAPERRIAAAGFMPMIGEEPLAHTKADGDYFKELERLRAAGDLDKFADLRNAGPPDGNSIPSIYLHLFSRRENGAAVKNLDTGEIKAAPAHFEALYKHPQGENIRGRLGTVFYDGTFHPEMRGGKETSTKGEEVVGPEASQGTTPAEWRQKNLAAAGFMPLAGPRARGFAEAEAERRVFETPLYAVPGERRRFEISDRDMTFKPAPEGSKALNALAHHSQVTWGDPMKLSDAIDHPQLFDNYSGLRDTKISHNPGIRPKGYYEQPQMDGGGYTHGDRIVLKDPTDKETLAHEIQHAVQYHENFAGGASVEDLYNKLSDDQATRQELEKQWPGMSRAEAEIGYQPDVAKLYWTQNKLRDMARAMYHTDPGEMEARAVGERAMMPPGWQVPPEESLRYAQQEAKARYPESRLAAAGFMPEIPEEVRLRGAGAEKGKEQVRLRYDGAPPGVKDARSLSALKERLIKWALEGEAFRFWYEEGARPMMRGVGNDPHRFEQLMANIAATNPQNRVYPNFGMAVRGLAQQEAGGRRITIGKGSMKERLSEIGQGNIWEGVKINQFYRDHMAVFDKRLEDDMGSTMDMHMARAFGYPTDSFTPKQSQWAQGIMREITEELGWKKPKQSQAAVWSAIKARYETVWPEIYAEAKANGDIITKVSKSGFEKSAFKDAATELKYRNRALKKAIQIPPPDLSEAAFNFGDALRRDLGAISYETRPSSIIQDQNPWMKQMTPQDWDEYHQQQANVLLDPDGTNKLAKLTNLISIGEHQGYSAWGTERNLSQQITAVMPKAAGVVLERAGQKWKIDPTIEKEVRDFAAAVGLLYQQDGVGYHRPYFDAGATQKEANGVRINVGRGLSSDETHAVVANLEKLLPSYEQDGAKGWFVAPEENGLRVVSWGHDDGKKIYDLVKKAVYDVPGTDEAHLDRFVSYGNLINNNWKENPNGESYRHWLGARRRSDVLGLVDDSLRPQVQAIDNQWRIRKSGETEGGRRAASPEEIGQAAPTTEEAPARAPPSQVGAMPEGPAAPRPRERAPPWIQPMAYPPQQQQPQELPGAVTELAPPSEPEVKPRMLPPLLPPSQQQAPPWQQPPSVESGDQTGVADFFRKRGDQPITSENDPRLTTISVGGQNWRVNQEAAPYFQGFLHDLASAGAPIRSDGGWVYREKVGAAGISEHAFGGAIDLNQEGRNEVTPAFQSWIAAHPGALAAAENKWHIYGGERFGDLGHFEWGGVPRSGYAAGGPDQETRRRTGSASAAHIMREEGPSDVQDGIPEIYGFRRGQDSEYEALAAARAAGDERQVQRIATKGFVDRAIEAGSQQFNDAGIKGQIMSLSHMRGVGGARDILNAVASGKIVNSGSVDHLDPNAVAAINQMPRAEVMRRIQLAREVYDKAVFGPQYWNEYGRGLSARYARERAFYTGMS